MPAGIRRIWACESSAFEKQTLFTFDRTERTVIAARRSNPHKLGLVLPPEISRNPIFAVQIGTTLHRSEPPANHDLQPSTLSFNRTVVTSNGFANTVHITQLGRHRSEEVKASHATGSL